MHLATSSSLLPRLIIDRRALAKNWRALSKRAEPGMCAAVVKANAYGLGLEPIVKTLWQEGCRVFFVALPQEALALRALYKSATIYVLSGLFEETLKLYQKNTLRPALNTMDEVKIWAAQSHKAARALPCALHIDTGMNRLGITLPEAEALAVNQELLDHIDLKLIMSHPACADTPEAPLNAKQQERFEKIRQRFENVPASLANSAATIIGGKWRYDIARPGIALYGGRALAQGENPMASVVTLTAPIAQIRYVPKGQTVGYGAVETTKRDTVLATLLIGYADGYPRLCSSTDQGAGARAIFYNDQGEAFSAPLIGRVSMDLITIDVTDIPEELVQTGASVELIGKTISIDEVAHFGQTIGYEILTQLGTRFERRDT